MRFPQEGSLRINNDGKVERYTRGEWILPISPESRIIRALDTLLNLKRHKDRFGKDGYYESQRVEAWKEAEDSLSFYLEYERLLQQVRARK